MTYQRCFQPDSYQLGYMLAHIPERDVQRGVVQLLRVLGVPAAEVDSGAKQMRASRGGFGGGCGAANTGVVDIIGTLPGGRALYLECKAPRWLYIGKRGKPVQERAAGEPSAEQLAFLDSMERAGACVGVVWSVEDAERIIRAGQKGGA